MFPLVAATCSSNLNHERHMAWDRNDPNVGGHGFDFYDLNNDVREILQKEDGVSDSGAAGGGYNDNQCRPPVLSIVRQFYDDTEVQEDV